MPDAIDAGTSRLAPPLPLRHAHRDTLTPAERDLIGAFRLLFQRIAREQRMVVEAPIAASDAVGHAEMLTDDAILEVVTLLRQPHPDRT